MKLRVLEVLATLNRGGAERIAVTLVRGLDPADFETGLVTLFHPGPQSLASELEGHPVRRWSLGKRKGFDPRMWPRLRRVFRQWRPHVIHTHSYVLRYVWPATLGAGRPAVIHTVHNEAHKEVDAIGRWFNRMAFRSGAAAVAISERIARSFRRVYGFDPAAVIPNGINLARYQDAAAGRLAWRSARGFQDDDFLVVSVARLEPQKDHLGLIRAFQLGLGQDPRRHLLIAGTGSDEPKARALASQLALERRVHLLGVVEDVPGLLGAADLFALSSRWEGSPLAVIEAMATGLPVVATAVGGVPELVLDRVTGLLVPPGDPARLSEALRLLASDPELRSRMSAAARERARQFTAEAMTSAYAELFRRCARIA